MKLKLSTINELRNRWSKSMLDEVNNAWSCGKNIISPFGQTEEGLGDFRGLIISKPGNRLSLNDIDLSGAKDEFFGQFVFCQFSRCVFISTTISTNFGDDFYNCDFRSIDLKEAIIRGVFKDCNFSFGNLTKLRAKEVNFHNCNFTEANLRRAEFYNCSFFNCNWTGVKFGGGALSRCIGLDGNFKDQDLKDTLFNSP